ncbi:MAG: hypothetical protein ABIJ16_13975, partial [Bacteroidota bacterium]
MIRKKIDFAGTMQLLAVLIAIYVMVIFRGGYEYGRNDSMQLAYSVHLHDHELYQGDLYIQQISSVVPNERYFFCGLMSVFGDLAFPAMAGHIIVSLLLFLAVYRIASVFIKEIKMLRWLALFVIFVVMYNVNLGGCELYYNNFFVSMIAKTAGAWGIYFLLRYRYGLAYILSALATFFHPVAGLHLFMIITVVIIV